MLEIIIDVVLLAVVFLGVVLGIKRGFIKMAAGPVKAVAALVIAIAFCSQLSALLVKPMIDAPITNYVRDFLYENCSSLTADNVNDELPTLMKIAAAVFGIDVTAVAGGATTTVVDAIIENLTNPVIDVISTILAFLALYIVSKILLNVVIWFIDLICRGGILGAFNKVLGVVFGGTVALLLSWGLAVVLEIVFHLPVFEGNELIANFEGGMLYKFFNTYNPIELLLSF